MSLVPEKSIRERICHAIDWYVKGNNKYMEYYDKNKESWYISIGVWIIFMNIQCHKSHQYSFLNGLEINLNLIKIY